MAKNEISYGRVQSTGDLGRLVRAHRKEKGLTLETVSGLGNLSTRFLSEFERGKETAEIEKVLKALRTLGLEVVVRPRRQGSFARAIPIKPETDQNSHD